jgi:hypothetical protein
MGDVSAAGPLSRQDLEEAHNHGIERARQLRHLARGRRRGRVGLSGIDDARGPPDEGRQLGHRGANGSPHGEPESQQREEQHAQHALLQRRHGAAMALDRDGGHEARRTM